LDLSGSFLISQAAMSAKARVRLAMVLRRSLPARSVHALAGNGPNELGVLVRHGDVDAAQAARTASGAQPPTRGEPEGQTLPRFHANVGATFGPVRAAQPSR
jgi:hypothetical protein